MTATKKIAGVLSVRRYQKPAERRLSKSTRTRLKKKALRAKQT